jgi:hypothetical protein
MHGVAQVVQQLANDLALVFLLHTAQDGGVGRRGGRFQCFLPLGRSGRNYLTGSGVPPPLEKITSRDQDGMGLSRPGKRV